MKYKIIEQASDDDASRIFASIGKERFGQVFTVYFEEWKSKEWGRSQKTFSEAVGVSSRQAVSLWQKGQRKPNSYKQFKKICEVLEINPDVFELKQKQEQKQYMTNRSLTQNQKILHYLVDHGSITPLEALSTFGCMRLASRISDLKKEGYPITSTIIKDRDSGQRYAVYTLGE